MSIKNSSTARFTESQAQVVSHTMPICSMASVFMPLSQQMHQQGLDQWMQGQGDQRETHLILLGQLGIENGQRQDPTSEENG